MKIWVTADTHFGHKNIIKHANRPFACVNDMDKVLIDNWNAIVGEHDRVYHLGDFAWVNPEMYFERLKGRVSILCGNHDHRFAKKRLSGFEFVKDVYQLEYNGKKIWMSHYAHRTWPSKNWGSIHIFGHSHGTLDDYGLSTDVGVDCSEKITGVPYSPMLLDDVIEYIERKAEAQSA